MAKGPRYVLTEEGLQRIKDSLRYTEPLAVERGFGAAGRERVGDYANTVLITGPRVAVGTSTTTTGTTSTTTTTTTTTDGSEDPGFAVQFESGEPLEFESGEDVQFNSGAGAPGESPPAPPRVLVSAEAAAPPAEYVYPCQYVYRDLSLIGTAGEYVVVGDCWAFEVEGYNLGIGCRYDGRTIGVYNDRGLVELQAYGTDDADCSTTTTTTTTTPTVCAGYCKWHLNDSRDWVRDSSTCSTGCGCPSPNYCPPDGGCAETTTFCYSGYSSPISDFNCRTTSSTTTTTGTGTSTSSTTTTTTSGACGTGCIIKYVPDLPFPGPFLTISNDCLNNFQYVDGIFTCVCGGCGPALPIPCIEQLVPCLVGCTAPPTPFCSGGCSWVWPDVAGIWWVLKENTCQHSEGVTCVCSPPSFPGDACNQKIQTPCYTPGSTATSTTGTGTTTTVGGCEGTCYLRWDDTARQWVAMSGCFGCGCSLPNYPGENDCTVAQVPCIVAPTTSTTTTTTSTTRNCLNRYCLVFCDQVIVPPTPGHAGVYAYHTVLNNCTVDLPNSPAPPQGCTCPPESLALVGTFCTQENYIVTHPCIPNTTTTTTTGTTTTTITTTTTSTTSTTTTTTPPPDNCDGALPVPCSVEEPAAGSVVGGSELWFAFSGSGGYTLYFFLNSGDSVNVTIYTGASCSDNVISTLFTLNLGDSFSFSGTVTGGNSVYVQVTDNAAGPSEVFLWLTGAICP